MKINKFAISSTGNRMSKRDFRGKPLVYGEGLCMRSDCVYMLSSSKTKKQLAKSKKFAHGPMTTLPHQVGLIRHQWRFSTAFFRLQKQFLLYLQPVHSRPLWGVHGGSIVAICGVVDDATAASNCQALRYGYRPSD